MSESVWSRKVDDIFGKKQINKGIDSGDYYQFQKKVVELNDCLPTDVYFRTQYTKAGYTLYLFSLPRMTEIKLEINLDSKIVFKSDGSYACAVEDLTTYLQRNDISTIATNDDIQFALETVPPEGGSDE